MTAPQLLLLIQAIGTGSITGTLRDASSNEPLSGAQVVVDLNHVVVTDTGGRYRVVRVAAGTHRLLVRRVGYAPRTLDVLVPTDGSVDVSVALRAEPVVLGVVEGSENSAWPVPSDRQVEGTAIGGHPLLAEPDVLQALSGGMVVVQPESPSGMHVRGGGSDQVTYLLDGFPVLSPYHSGESFSAWNPDALGSAALQPSSESWDALSGVVSATSRTPGKQTHVATAFTTTQMRLTVDGRFGRAGRAAYLWSERSAFPGFPAPQRDPTYLHGEAGDRLVKVEVPVGGGGRFRLLGYTSANELDTDGPPGTASRNTFDWQSTTLGGEWSAPWGTGVARARVWTAGQDANALWQIVPTNERLATRRRDAGMTFTWERSGPRGRTALGTRLQTSRTAYNLTIDSGAAISYASDAPLVAGFVELSRTVGSHVGVLSGITATQSAGAGRLSPRAWLYWKPVDGLLFSGAYLRLYQFAQSLRNPESVAGMVFPVDLFVGATRGGRGGVPIARSDAGVLTVEYRPAVELRLSAQAYLRAFDDIALVAPRSHDPFATAPFWIGSGTARGFTLDLTRATARATLVLSYGRQYARFWYGANSYVPDYVATDAIDAGIGLHPGRHISIRAAASGRFGRRATALATPFEWESCNMTDRGCEFAGSPRTGDTLSAVSLPGYLRFDLGLRTHWSVRVGSRLTELGLFGTFTNLFARTNVLTMAPDRATGSATSVPLRSRVPLVVGVDWAF